MNWFDLTSWPLAVFPVVLLSTFPERFQVIQTHPPLQSQTCNSSTTTTQSPQKRLKIVDVPIHLSCHFSVRTHHKGTLQPGLGILIYLQDQYLSTTSKINLSPKQSPNIKILFKCDMLIHSRTRITVMGDRGFTDMLRD